MRIPFYENAALRSNGTDRLVLRPTDVHPEEVGWFPDGDIVNIIAGEMTEAQARALDEKVNAQIHDDPSTWFNLSAYGENGEMFMQLRDVHPGSQVSGALRALIGSTGQQVIMDGRDMSDWSNPTAHNYWGATQHEYTEPEGTPQMRGLRGDLIHFPDSELLADVEMLRSEGKWRKAMTTKGSWVVVEGPIDEPDIVGRIVVPAKSNPPDGTEQVLVEHENFERTSQGRLVRVDGPTVQRWYSAFNLAPYQAPGRVIKMRR